MGAFAQGFSALIHLNRWKQKEVAEMIGTSQANVSRWVKGECKPSFGKVQQIANRLGVSVDELLGKKSPAPSQSIVRESPITYNAVPDPHMLQLRRRWQKGNSTERAQIELALRALWGDDSKTVKTWLEEP